MTRPRETASHAMFALPRTLSVDGVRGGWKHRLTIPSEFNLMPHTRRSTQLAVGDEAATGNSANYRRRTCLFSKQLPDTFEAAGEQASKQAHVHAERSAWLPWKRARDGRKGSSCMMRSSWDIIIPGHFPWRSTG